MFPMSTTPMVADPPAVMLGNSSKAETLMARPPAISRPLDGSIEMLPKPGLAAAIEAAPASVCRALVRLGHLRPCWGWQSSGCSTRDSRCIQRYQILRPVS